MHLLQLPEDWLRDILLFRDFTTRWRLRRCCRKWHQLSLAKLLNTTIALEGSFATSPISRRGHLASCQQQFRSALLAVQPHVASILARGALTGARGAHSAILVALSVLAKAGRKANRHYQLRFCDTPDWTMQALLEFNPHGNTFSLVLINVHTDFESLWLDVEDHLESQATLSDMVLRLSSKLTCFVNEEDVHGRYYISPGAWGMVDGGGLKVKRHGDFYRRVLLDILPALDGARWTALQAHDIPGTATGKWSLRRIGNMISSRLPSDWGFPKELPAGPIESAQLPKIVAWLAFAFFCCDYATLNGVNAV